MDTKHITYKKIQSLTRNIQFGEMAGETFTDTASTRNIQFLVPLSRQFLSWVFLFTSSTWKQLQGTAY